MAVYLGIDVGTGSARAGLFDVSGRLLGHFAHPIGIYRPQTGFGQQSSAEIWAAICRAVKGAIDMAEIDAAQISGIGFDATCSMVVDGRDGGSVSVSPDGAPDQDIIMWLDHRAVADADEINASGAEQLNYVGGVMSPEMQMPKLRWLKRELPDSWAAAGRFWDLPDWLVHRATATTTRSMCSSVCKWAYLGQNGTRGEGWDRAFLSQIGLEDLADDDFAKIGTEFASAGQAVGRVSENAAGELGVPIGIPVSSGLIDAYSGALGTMGAMPDIAPLTERLAVIAGTSACHITVGPEPAFVPGVWGPYRSVLLPDLWSLEGGQSAAGALVEAVIARHGAASTVQAEANAAGCSVHDKLAEILADMGPDTAFLTHDRHVQPDFLGNRAPLADPNRKGAISGLTLDVGAQDLALDYLATIQALAYGTRHIVEEMRVRGLSISVLVFSGGLTKNALFLREVSDATGCTVIVPHQAEPVLLGSAMLGAVAGQAYDSVAAAAAGMSGEGDVLTPRGGDVAAYHARKYRVFRRMLDDYSAYRDIMNDEDNQP